jgi:cation:H+ antiporter
MLLSLLLLIVGLVLLIGGADLLVRGVSALAAAVGVSPLVIGLTVVAFGTSTPELVVNGMSAWQEQTQLAFGNIVGASILNLGFVLAVAAIVRPLDVQPSVLTREIPLMVMAILAVLIMVADRFLGVGADNTIDRGDGLILMLIFAAAMYSTAMMVISRNPTDHFMETAGAEGEQIIHKPLGLATLMTVGGLIGVAVGGRITVSSAVEIAELLGVPQVIIGLTLLSLGTTLPELTTSVVAARRGQSDIAIGNVVGSCVYNLLFIGGIVAFIHPIELPAGGMLDLLVLTGLSVVLFPLALQGPRNISRLEGAFLLVVCVTYLTWRTLTHGGV